MSNDPTATIREGMMRGMMIHLSICKKRLPTNLTYIISLAVYSSSLVLIQTPKTMPIITPAKVARVKALDFMALSTDLKLIRRPMFLWKAKQTVTKLLHDFKCLLKSSQV